MKWKVLIVAKCIVNITFSICFTTLSLVLIVAKCIVNSIIFNIMIYKTIVLIVAKCIVNPFILADISPEQSSINSSKVYCK